jgi:hypothetical protein
MSNGRAKRPAITRCRRIGKKSLPMLELPAVEISRRWDGQHEFLNEETEARI